jgi:hypothetical protein
MKSFFAGLGLAREILYPKQDDINAGCIRAQ